MSEEAAKRHAQESVFEYRVPQTLGVAMAWKTCLDRDEDHLYKPKIKGVFDYIDLATSTFSPSYTQSGYLRILKPPELEMVKYLDDAITIMNDDVLALWRRGFCPLFYADLIFRQ